MDRAISTYLILIMMDMMILSTRQEIMPITTISLKITMASGYFLMMGPISLGKNFSIR
jgi:hypothetical protein